MNISKLNLNLLTKSVQGSDSKKKRVDWPGLSGTVQYGGKQMTCREVLGVSGTSTQCWEVLGCSGKCSAVPESVGVFRELQRNVGKRWGVSIWVRKGEIRGLGIPFDSLYRVIVSRQGEVLSFYFPMALTPQVVGDNYLISSSWDQCDWYCVLPKILMVIQNNYSRWLPKNYSI